ncbi:solute carrier family 34 (sodium-dependent phosphate cotransporter) [Chryseolinea serpens]|uniref:Solute carrier family 34 (Sodium-dependent phosphate cotransporter) n=1 Tax=Chryseolinea serpens TaxID=947013 RepID=A0A1M5XMG4_9BACT|nr:Na/Pi symporter [Chryseolinea serpens]SHI00842.1 solute carrier family 34 (sodium-dependent phosphate cotransporter) [Chryseolinea serpens]
MEPVPHTESNLNANHNAWSNVRIVLAIAGAFVLFLFALDLMTSSLQHMGKNVAETILLATSNPFTGLFIGLLITAMLQSSSTTTSLVVALVASGSITLQSAIPIIMGANIGTTITSTLVSLSFINKKKEFRRAVAAGTYHDFFNILTATVLFPLEYYYGFLSSLSAWITSFFFSPVAAPVQNKISHFWVGFSPVIDFLIREVPSPFFLAFTALVLLFSSILIFRRLISNLLKAKSPEQFGRFFFKNQFKSFLWGLLTTAAIRSSTITTSVVVPIVAKKIANLKQAAPFIMGANVGTTITAFIAATLNANTAPAISIAIAHFLFNFIGVLLFFPVPVMRRLPMALAEGLGKLALKYRLVGFVYILVTFFFVPFTLIYFNRDSIKTLDLDYAETTATGETAPYRVVIRTNVRTQTGEWTKYNSDEPGAEPAFIYPMTVKNNTLLVGKQMFRFSRPGFCWDGEDEKGKFKTCIVQILPKMEVAGQSFDSVFVAQVNYEHAIDSVAHRYYMNATYKILLQHEILTPGKAPLVAEKLTRFGME